MKLGAKPPQARPARRLLLAGAVCVTVLALPKGGRAQASAQEDADAAQPVIEMLNFGRSQPELQFAPGFDTRLRDEARARVRSSGDAVAAYFGGFPVAQAEPLLQAVDGAGVGGGVTFGEPTPFIRVRLGRDTTQAQFLDDWILVHEMVHLAIPRVARAQNWLHEGIATDVEGVARGRARLVPEATVWRSWAKAMPQGQPRAGDAGLDHTPTWGSTYWGGAMLCLLADVQMLKRSAGKAGVQQALRGVIAAGDSYAMPWPLQRILDTADAAVGQTTLAALYARMKDAPAPADLEGLWRELGVASEKLDDTAPWAAVRRAILS